MTSKDTCVLKCGDDQWPSVDFEVQNGAKAIKQNGKKCKACGIPKCTKCVGDNPETDCQICYPYYYLALADEKLGTGKCLVKTLLNDFDVEGNNNY